MSPDRTSQRTKERVRRASGLLGGVKVEVALGDGRDVALALLEPGQEPHGRNNRRPPRRHCTVGEIPGLSLVLEPAQNVPAGEAVDEMGMFLGQGGEQLRHPWGDAFQFAGW